MHDPHEFLKALMLVLCVAAVTTVLFQRLRQPVVLGYVLAGMIVGPHVPIPLLADASTIQTLSELGVILLMFSLGLEFSLRKLFSLGATAGLTALIECSLMIWLGFVAGRAFGWSPIESLFAGGAIMASSTIIVVKAFDEAGIKAGQGAKSGGGLREAVIGVLVVEDLVAVLLMATLTAVATGSKLSAGALGWTLAELVGFLVALVGVGLLVVPRSIRAVQRLGRPETTTVASIGLCFAFALLAQEFGYSVALGAFIAGCLVAESGEAHHIEPLVTPVRDVFAAVFFVSVGMMIDPALIAEHWLAVVVFSLLVMVGKTLGVGAGSFLTGQGVRRSVQAGMSMTQIGEFAFIIAGLGVSLKATGDFLYPVAVAVSALTTLTTPWFIRAAGPVANFVDRKLPKPLQTFAALYGSWVEALRQSAPRERTASSSPRRPIVLLVLDAGLLAALVIGASLSIDRVVEFLHDSVGLSERLARVLLVGGAVVVALPLFVGIVRSARRLATLLADRALPERTGDGQQVGHQVDLATAPRRALVATLQVGIVVLVGVPWMALTQPFLSGVPAVVVLVVLAVVGVAFWRSATNLEGHVRAGAQVLVEVLASQSHSAEAAAPGLAPDLTMVNQLLPGLGAPVSMRIDAASAAVGRTLAQLNLRGVTGAIVLAITHGDETKVPGANQVLQAGDVLAVAGTQEAVEAARALLAAEHVSGHEAVAPEAEIAS